MAFTKLYFRANVITNKIASIPFSFGPSTHANNAYFDNDDIIVFKVCTFSATGFFAIRINKKGEWAAFQTANLSGLGNSSQRQPINLGNGIFIAPCAEATYLVTIPRIYDSKLHILNPPVLNVTNSCVLGAPKYVYYDRQSGILAGEWQVPAGQNNTDFYSSFYKSGAYSSLTKISEGFVGNSSQEIFNKSFTLTGQYFSQTYSGDNQSDEPILQDNGLTFNCNFGWYGSSLYGAQFNNQKIYVGQNTDCLTPNDSYVYSDQNVVSENGVNPNWYQYGNCYAGNTNIPYAGFVMQQTAPFLVDLNMNILQFFASNFVGSPNNGALNANGDLFMLSTNGSVNVFYTNVFNFLSPFTGLTIPAPTFIKNSLVNLGRPVSVLGKYRT